MKNLILSLACFCSLSLATIAPTASYGQSSTMDSKKMKDKDGSLMMKDGKMMVMKNGSWMPMTMDMTMSNGAKVMVDGTVMMKDGKKKMMKNGECMKPDGMMKKM